MPIAALFFIFEPAVSLAPQNRVSGRTPFERVRVEYDQCSLTYASSPCTAVLGVTGDRKCFNTLRTCQSVANYALETVEPLMVAFSSNQVASLTDEYTIPSLVNVSVSPAKLNPAGGGSLSSLGQRSTISVTFQDHPHTDRVTDPYVDERRTGAAQSDGVGYDPLALGTFWGKWQARQGWMANRKIVYESGYIVDGELVNIKEQTFFAQAVNGPDASGRVTLQGIDPLGLIRNDKAQAPARSTGSLLNALTTTATTATLNPAGIGNAGYPANGKVRIGDEVLSFTRIGDVMTFARAQNFTSAQEHDAGALVQLCQVFTPALVSDILYTLLTTYGGISVTLIDKTAWDAEVSAYSSRLYSAILTEPEGVASLVAELTEQAGVYLWYDGAANTIRLRAVRPADASVVFDVSDDSNIVADTFQPRNDNKSLTTQVWVSFAQRDPTKKLDEPANYAGSEVAADLTAEGVAQNRGSNVRRIYSRWITSTGAATALDTAERILERYKQPIKTATFQLDAKDDAIELADFLMVRHRQIQDETGAPAPTMFQVLERSEAVTGTTIQVTVQESPSYSAPDDDETVVIITGQNVNVNLRTVYDSQVGVTPQTGDKVRFILRPNAVIGGYACGIYTDGVVSVAPVGDNELRALYLANVQPVVVTQANGIVAANAGATITKYLPVMQRRGGASVLTTIGNAIPVGNRAAGLTATAMCDLRTVPTVPALTCGTWPSGVQLTLEIQPGAAIYGEGGAAGYAYAQPDAAIYSLGAGVQANSSQKILRGFAASGVYGGDGGDAIDADYPLTIINNGTISAGGGGGAAALSWESSANSYVNLATNSWSQPGTGGQGYFGGESISQIMSAMASDVGARGGVDAAGRPVGAFFAGGSEYYYRAGIYFVSGTTKTVYARIPLGGDFGADGQTNRFYYSGGPDLFPEFTSGGLAGRAVVQSSNVTWATRGVVIGSEV